MDDAHLLILLTFFPTAASNPQQAPDIVTSLSAPLAGSLYLHPNPVLHLQILLFPHLVAIALLQFL
jgi:hypothetical protein